MRILRFIGFWLLIVTVVVLVFDGTRSLADSRLVFSSLETVWHLLAPNGPVNAKNVIVGHIHPWLWEYFIVVSLSLPAWLVFGVLGVWLSWIGRKRTKVDIFMT
jgi:hypothetical protein